ncbi:ABC transporter permease [Flagellimonas allohymeniacidonis]|uniref:ABC transporter permease n=1 Tax=Flagellimonas allohymeniacidonis TaxID=2517819 RepID=A0A4Q8QGA7_9FLAO|nr:FtsX-like permease family protein [Allomuricauda hymeniacidonis]TAI47623.1 ABC transporter permease [Allomuricauda hymeniacidonis]
MNFPFYIAKRYLRSKSSQNAVNIINFITFLVIVIGSAALFVVLSAFAGLKTFSLSFTNSFDPDLKAIPITGKTFSISPEEEAQLGAIEGVTHFSKELEERAYLTFRGKSCIAYIKGIDDNYRTVTGVDSTLYFGNWGITEYNAVMGIGLYNLLGAPVDNYQTPISVLVPKPGKGSINQQSLNAKPYNQLPLVISGVYAVEENLDKKYLFAHLPLVQSLLEKDTSQISGINFKLNNSSSEETIKQAVLSSLGNKVLVLSRQELNSTLYRMLNTENLATYLIFTLVLIIALFNVVGAIIMLILDKQQNSKTLYSLGTTIKELRRVYFIQGILVTTLGGLIGVLLGSLLIGSQLAFGWLKITATLAYPVEYDYANVFIVLGTIVVLGYISSKIASSRISKKLIEA